MKNTKQLCFLLLMLTHCAIQAQPSLFWETMIGTLQYDQLIEANAINSDQFLMAINTEGGVSGMKQILGDGEKAVWLLTMNNQGQIRKELVLKNEKNERITTCIPTPDGGYAIGGIKSEGLAAGTSTWMRKLDANGVVEWEKVFAKFRGASYINLKLAPDFTFRTIVHAMNYGATSISQNMVVSSLDAKGMLLWEKKFYDKEAGAVTAYNLNEVGGIYIAFNHIKKDAPPQETNVHLTFIDQYGNLQWHKPIGTKAAGYVKSIHEMSDKSVLLAGQVQDTTNRNLNFWLTEIAPDTQVRGEYFFGGNGKEACSGMLINNQGEILLCGYSNSSENGDKTTKVAGREDIWMLCLDAEKKVLWDYSFGGERSEYLSGLLVDGADKFMVIATTEAERKGFGQVDLRLVSFGW